jgi:hypothetical protein
MKNSIKIFFFILIFNCNQVLSQFNYQRQWATYSGGRGTSYMLGAVDSQKNLITIGTISLLTQTPSYYNQFATFGSYQPTIAGDTDLYLTKFSPNGVLIWATYFGGSSFDNLSSFTLDADDNIYFSGQTGSAIGITTSGTYIPDFSPNTFAKYYLVKFNSNGMRQWGTYLPGIINAIALGANNTIYAAGSTSKSFVGLTNPGVFRENFEILSGFDPNDNQYLNGHIIQLDTATGNKINGTYCGPYFEISSMSTDSAGNLIVGGNTNVFCLDTALSTPGAYQELQVNCRNYGLNSGGNSDCVISKFSPNLQTRLWSTYYGGISGEGIFSLTTDGEDIYISNVNGNNNILPTAGTFQQTPSGTLVSKFNGAGNRVWATGFGDNDTFIGGLSVINNKLFFSGIVLATTTFPIATAGAYQETISGLTYIDSLGNPQTCYKGFFGQFNATTGTRDWSSYYSGELYDFVGRMIVEDENTFYLMGGTSSATGIATAGSHQPNISAETNTFPPDPISYRTNGYIAKFSIPALSTNNFSKTSLQLSPNPSNGIFSLQGDLNGYNNMQLVLCDNLGRNVAKSEVTVLQNQVNQVFNFSNELTSGVYNAKLVSDNKVLQVFKVLVQ